MSKWIVDIHGDIEGDYDLIAKYTEPKTGHWIETDKNDPCWYMCSKCHWRSDLMTNFCAYCGAKMESEV